MDDMSPDDDAPATGPWSQPWFVIAAVALAFIAVLAFVLALTGPADREAAAPGPPPKAAGATQSATGPRASACGLAGGEQDVPVVAPARTRWELVGTMAAPTAPDAHGPGVVDDGFRSCFAHSPVGALYAAVSFWALGTAKPGAEVMERLAAETVHRARAIRDARAGGDEPALDRSTTLQVAGFRFVSYDAGTATIDLAVRVSNGGTASLPTTLQWEDGDWKYVVPSDGDPGVSQLPDLAGYATWVGA